MSITGRDIARALERANVCSSKQADVIARELDAAAGVDPHVVLHESVAGLWEQVIALQEQIGELSQRRKPGPKPKGDTPAEPQA